MSQLSEAIQEMRNMREAYDQLLSSSAALSPDIVQGKAAIAQAITDKGVTTPTDATLADMAENVELIQQETYQINGGDMYAKQLFGALSTPNYWNLYEVMASLLSDGRFVNYGGILLAEYYKGYATIALSGAGAGGGYVTSDGQYYTEDTTHTWNDDADGKGNRWVAYLFASEGHGFTISDTNTCPRSIHIGRHVGTIECLATGRISDIIVTDGNTLDDFKGNYQQNWNKKVVLRNIATITENAIYDAPCNIESVYVKANTISSNGAAYTMVGYSTTSTLKSLVLECQEMLGCITTSVGGSGYCELTYESIIADTISGYLHGGNYRTFSNFKTLAIIAESVALSTYDVYDRYPNFTTIICGYKTNDKTKSFILYGRSCKNVEDVVLQDGWCKTLGVSNCESLTEANMYAHILQRLKQDEEDCGDGVTITLGATNLAKLTSEASVALLDSLTNTYGYTFA